MTKPSYDPTYRQRAYTENPFLDPTRYQRPEMRNFVVIGSTLLTDEGQVLTNVHDARRCQLAPYKDGGPRPCVIHAPSRHHMDDWPLHYRADRGIFERLCDHGVGHPDPDQFDFWRDTNQSYNRTHGCDGCCLRAQRRNV